MNIEKIISITRSWGCGGNLKEIWESCQQLDRLLWLCLRMAGKDGWPDHRTIVSIACDIADHSIPYLTQVDDSRLKCGEVVRKWLNEEATVDDMREARIAAYGYAFVDAYVWDAQACSSEDNPGASATASYAIDSVYLIYDAACKTDGGHEVQKKGLDLLRERLAGPSFSKLITTN